MSLSVRLWIAGGVALLLALAYWHYSTVVADLKLSKSQYETLQQEAANLRGANKANAETIARLEANRKLDLAAIDRLTVAVGAVAAKADRTRTIIREIERNDPVVADLLSTPLPDSLRDALNAPNR